MTRNIDERMAEISRRSEAIFRQRKQRRSRILAACVPLVLLVGIATPFLRPERVPDSVKTEPDTWGSQQTVSVGSVSVSGAGISHRYASAADVSRITELIEGICAGASLKDEESTKPSDQIQDYDVPGQPSLLKYTVLVTNADGTVTQYSLLPALLINQKTNERFPLDPQTDRALKDALGILGNSE